MDRQIVIVVWFFRVRVQEVRVVERRTSTCVTIINAEQGKGSCGQVKCEKDNWVSINCLNSSSCFCLRSVLLKMVDCFFSEETVGYSLGTPCMCTAEKFSLVKCALGELFKEYHALRSLWRCDGSYRWLVHKSCAWLLHEGHAFSGQVC